MAKLNYKTQGGKGLSHSRILTLHECPRKFEIENVIGFRPPVQNVNFAYGHAVAAGIQSLVQHPDNLDLALVHTLAQWDAPLELENNRKKKSLWYAVRAVEKFYNLLQDPTTNFLRDYEVAYFTGADGVAKPAVELFAAIKCYEGYMFEVHVDLILKQRGQNKYMILEIKTTGFSQVHEAQYKNSPQALGYSVILDSIVGNLGATNSYFVLYLVYKSGAMEYETLPFPKSRLQRAHWLQSLVLDIEFLELCRQTAHYPTHGESCYNFFSPCEYFDICSMSNESIQKLKGASELEGEEPGALDSFSTEGDYDFEFTLEDIRNQQLTILHQETQELVATTTPT